MEINTLKFDLDALKQEMNDRLSLLSSNISTDQLNKVISERDQYFVELNQLKTELPELKRQMVDSFQTRVVAFKEQVKKSLVDKENEYRKRIEQIENEYISEYEQVLEKNRQVVKAVVTSKQDDFNAEKVRPSLGSAANSEFCLSPRFESSLSTKKSSVHFRNNRYDAEWYLTTLLRIV